MNILSLEQLAEAGRSKWHAWLRNGIKAFTRTSDPMARAEAFAPLTVSGLSHYPAAELEREIGHLLKGKDTIVGEAAAKVLRTWSVEVDGAAGATMGIELATRLNAPGLARLCSRIVAQPMPVSEREATRLVWACIAAMGVRGRDREKLGKFAMAVGEAQLWTADLAAEYALILARCGLSALPDRLSEDVRLLAADPQSSTWLPTVIDRLLLDFTADQLRAAFSPKKLRAVRDMDNEDKAEAYRFRKRLLNGLGSAERPFEGSPDQKELSNVLTLIANSQPLEKKLADTIARQFPETGTGDVQAAAGGQSR
jgi:hypothetical protein